MTDDAQQDPLIADAEVEQDPEVQAAEAVETQAHVVVERVRADALARAKHARDLAALKAHVDAEQVPATAPAVPAIAQEAVEVVVPEPVAVPPVVEAPPVPEPTPAPEIVPEIPTAAPDPVPSPIVVEPVTPTPEPVAEVVPEPEPPAPVEARSRRAPFASGRTKPGPRTFDARSGAVVSKPFHEWLRVRADLTDAEAADGEAGGARLQALVTTYGADALWAATRPT